MNAVTALFIRDVRLAVRIGGGAIVGVLFFLIVVTLVPLAVGPDLVLLARIGPAILWLGALLASLLALDHLFLNIDANAMAAVVLTLLAGTPALTLIGAIGAALSVALRRGGLLLPVLVLPLTIPVLIFGVAAANAAIVGPVAFGAPFTILCALSLASLAIGPFAAAAALRQGME